MFYKEGRIISVISPSNFHNLKQVAHMENDLQELGTMEWYIPF